MKTGDILRSYGARAIQREAVRGQLEQVLSSAGFSRNERLSRFLRFIVERRLEGRESELKESLIAIEVFGRKPDYDPKQDAIVRTEAVRLRARLSKYYAGEGSSPRAAMHPCFASLRQHVTSGKPLDELAKMRATAEKAIQLDPLLAEAHDTLGLVYARDGQWEQAEKSFRHALELDPNRTTTYNHYAISLLMVVGRIAEALQQLHTAEKVDPPSSDVHSDLAVALISARRYDEAADYCLKLPEADSLKTQCLTRARLGQGRNGDAIQLLAGDPTPPNPGFLGYAYARSGRRTEAEELAAASPNPYQQALIFAGLGDKDRTFEALDRMAALGALRVGLALNYPELALLRGDVRLKALRKKVGLPE